MEVLGTLNLPDASRLMIINIAQLRMWAQRAAGAFAECPSFIHSGVPSLETGDRDGEDPAWSLRKRKPL